MAENLAYKSESGSWAYDDDENNVSIFGRLYTWETAKTACPSGWHLPSDVEWNTLCNILGGKSEAGGKMKSTSQWEIPNTGATNESGFNCLPAGCHRNDGLHFYFINENAGFWTSTKIDSEKAWTRFIYYSFSELYRYDYNRTYGFSVRCTKD